MKNKILNQNGFSLLEAVITLGILSMGAYMAASNLEINAKMQKGSDLNADVSLLSNRIMQGLTEAELCAKSLKYQTLVEGQSATVWALHYNPPEPVVLTPDDNREVDLGPNNGPNLINPQLSQSPAPPQYAYNPNVIVAPLQQYGNLNVISVVFRNIQPVVDSTNRKQADLEVQMQKQAGAGGFFGSQTITKRFPVVATIDTTTNRIIGCYGKDSESDSVAQACSSVGGVYDVQSEQCNLMPSSAPTRVRTLAALACDVNFQYCPPSTMTQMRELYSGAQQLNDGQEIAYGIGYQGSTAEQVEAKMQDLIVEIDWNDTNFQRGTVDVFVDGARVGRIYKAQGSQPIIQACNGVYPMVSCFQSNSNLNHTGVYQFTFAGFNKRHSFVRLAGVGITNVQRIRKIESKQIRWGSEVFQ